MTYKCDRCGYETTLMGNFKKHVNRVTPCEPLFSDVPPLIMLNSLLESTKNTRLSCDHCGKVFSSPQSKYQHKKRCLQNVENRIESTVNDTLITSLVKKVNELEKRLEETQSREHRTVTNNFNNCKIQQNIVLHGFGHESLSHLPRSFLNYCFANKDIVQLIENVHFDKECPENQNVRIKSTKNELMEYFQNGGWVISSQDRILTELIQKGYRILRTHGKSNKNEIMNEEDIEESDYDDVLRWLEDVYEDEKQQRPIKKDLLVLFLNNRPILLGKDN